MQRKNIRRKYKDRKMNAAFITTFLFNGITQRILRRQIGNNNNIVTQFNNCSHNRITFRKHPYQESWKKDSFKDVYSIQETMQEPIKNLYPRI